MILKVASVTLRVSKNNMSGIEVVSGGSQFASAASVTLSTSPSRCEGVIS